LKSRAAGPVFIIGTGRSGTNWLAQTLAGHPNIRATIEVEPMFGYSTRMALDPRLEDTGFEALVAEYKKQILISGDKLYVDKSHPNIWLVEKLIGAFPQARFINITRNIFATVASMMLHSGVLHWQETWRSFPIPNRFLGITEELAKVYDRLPLATQCGFRWKAHFLRAAHLVENYPDSVISIDYDDLVEHQNSVLVRIQNFLDLEFPIPSSKIDEKPLDKWTKQLSLEEVDQLTAIQKVTYSGE